ncbi:MULTISPECIES: hypothetical protein [Deefgea]|uniref:Uncharacterized protein n=1 Tax=Deefgea chitinilytica TaxID=570276 RepID=A0ABS2C8T9_9NEIS|nr:MULTISPECIES: hypothetical protein [Deefgea]MBM5570558.1 hypothetical protein [Deefgea chitinilytica]MBM9887787.1 hypothetical protein [Deefgea sp. CFH1-16]
MAMTDKEFEKMLDKRRFTTNTKEMNETVMSLLQSAILFVIEQNSGRHLGMIIEQIDDTSAQQDRAMAWANAYASAGLGLKEGASPLSRKENPDKLGTFLTKVSADALAEFRANGFDLVAADKFAADYPNPMSWKGYVAKKTKPKPKEFDCKTYAYTVAKHFLENGISEAAAISALKAAFTHQLDTHSNKSANENKFLDDTEISSSVRTLQGGLPTLGKRR